jgi:hypothetical protein
MVIPWSVSRPSIIQWEFSNILCFSWEGKSDLEREKTGFERSKWTSG